MLAASLQRPTLGRVPRSVLPTVEPQPHLSPVASRVDTLRAALSTAESVLQRHAGLSARLAPRATASCELFASEMKEACAAVAAAGREHLADLRSIIKWRLKAWEGLEEALDTNRKQFDMLVALIEAAIASGDEGAITAAARAASTSLPLLEEDTDPLAALGLAFNDVITLKYEGEARLRSGRAGATLYGTGLEAFPRVPHRLTILTDNDDSGPREEEEQPLAVFVRVYDESETLIDSVIEADVEVRVEGGTVVSTSVCEPGVTATLYRVTEGVEAVFVHISLYGVPVQASPVRVLPETAGVLVRTIPLVAAAGLSGLAVSPNLSLLATCSVSTNCVYLYRLPDGDYDHSFNGGSHALESPMGLCFSPSGDALLVAESRRVHEVTLAGDHMRDLLPPAGFKGSFADVKTDGALVAAAVTGHAHSVFVFDYVRGNVLRSFGSGARKLGAGHPAPPPPWCLSLCFAPGNTGLLVAADLNAKKVSYYHAGGGKGDSKAPKAMHVGEVHGVALSPGGEMAVAEQHGTYIRLFRHALTAERREVVLEKSYDCSEVRAVTFAGGYLYCLARMRKDPTRSVAILR